MPKDSTTASRWARRDVLELLRLLRKSEKDTQVGWFGSWRRRGEKALAAAPQIEPAQPLAPPAPAHAGGAPMVPTARQPSPANTSARGSRPVEFPNGVQPPVTPGQGVALPQGRPIVGANATPMAPPVSQVLPASLNVAVSRASSSVMTGRTMPQSAGAPSGFFGTNGAPPCMTAAAPGASANGLTHDGQQSKGIPSNGAEFGQMPPATATPLNGRKPTNTFLSPGLAAGAPPPLPPVPSPQTSHQQPSTVQPATAARPPLPMPAPRVLPPKQSN